MSQPRRRPTHREDDEQQALFRWARIVQQLAPELSLLHHIPNGGSRDKREAARLTGLGVKPGVPDLCLPVARHGHNGLYIEMKGARAPGYTPRVSPDQKRWIEKLTEQGYLVVVCYGWVPARDQIKAYLGIKRGDV